MRFWDSSALIPLMLDEPRSDEMRQLLAEDWTIVTSAITPIEIACVLWRKRHHDELSVPAHHEADVAFATLSTRWDEVAYSSAVAEHALDVVSRQSLRSLDALQLASAIAYAGKTAFLAFVALDEKLRKAARAEGFRVLP